MRSWMMGLALALVACGGSDATIGGEDKDAAADAHNNNDDKDSGSSGGDASTGGDAGMDAASGDDAGDGSVGPKYNGRLFVSNGGSAPAVWENANALAMNVAPSFTLADAAVTSGTRGVVIGKKRIFFGAEPYSGVLVAFDDPQAMLGNAGSSAKLPVGAFLTNGPGTSLLQYDEKTDSLWVSGFNNTHLFSGASALTSLSKAKALFKHMWDQTPGVAYEPGGDRLFLGQISGAGVQAFSGATAASGSPSPSFTLEKNMAAWSQAVDKDRLYAIGSWSGSGNARLAINVWKSASTLSATKSPDFTITSGLATSDFSPSLTVQSDTLIACLQSGKVLLWTKASSLAGDQAPTQTITLGSVQPKKALLGPVTGRLYVLDGSSVRIYESPTTAPKLVATITSGISKAMDFAILE